jgi:predicted TIM-barrel fold metal-dependent hydrolase
VIDCPIVDAHHHLWQLSGGPLRYPWLQDPEPHDFFLGDYAALRRDYLPADYRADAAGLDVVATVHVEAECRRDQQVAETDWLLAQRAAHGLPSVIVAHAWFHTADAADVLARQAARPRVRGIRSKPVTAERAGDPHPDGPGSMQDPAWRRGLARLREHRLSWDLRVPAWHLEEAAEVLAPLTDLPVALNHAGLPWDRSAAGISLWRRGMRALAALPNVHCKLSCLCLPDGPWRIEENRPIVLEAIATFGAQRCMVASNFPVDSLRIGYRALFDAFDAITAALPAADRRAIFHDTAARFYRVAEPG